MPLLLKHLRRIGEELDKQLKEHRALLPRWDEIPVGGAHMDPFFRAEALRGLLSALRKRVPIVLAIEAGVAEAKAAIAIWNRRREYQVHRWDGWVEGYLHSVIRRISHANNP